MTQSEEIIRNLTVGVQASVPTPTRVILPGFFLGGASFLDLKTDLRSLNRVDLRLAIHLSPI